MRHRRKTVKLGRTSSHRNALLAGLVCHLIEQRRITTTLPKAKAARSLAERMVTLGKRGTLAARRQAVSRLRRKGPVTKLFDEVAPGFSERAGGYTRIYKLGRRSSDSSEMAILEWVDYAVPAKAAKTVKAKEDAAKKTPATSKADAKKDKAEVKTDEGGEKKKAAPKRRKKKTDEKNKS